MESKDKFYKPFKSRRMSQEHVILCDKKYQMPMVYNGEKNAQKAAEKYNGRLMRIPMQMNRYYIEKL